MQKIVIIHGVAGLEKESYFPHLKMACEKMGLKVFMPSLGSYKDNITYEKWRDFLDQNILPEIDSRTIFVGQSLGTQFLVKYIVEKNLQIGAYISAAGAYDFGILRESARSRSVRFAGAFEPFQASDAEYKAFSLKKFPKFSLYSDNDFFFEQSNLEKYCKKIGSTPIFLRGKGHFNVDEGVFELDELENLIKKLITE